MYIYTPNIYYLYISDFVKKCQSKTIHFQIKLFPHLDIILKQIIGGFGAKIKYHFVDFRKTPSWIKDGLKFVLQDTKIRSLADIELKIFTIYSFLKPPFWNPIWRLPGVNFEWLQIAKCSWWNILLVCQIWCFLHEMHNYFAMPLY